MTFTGTPHRFVAATEFIRLATDFEFFWLPTYLPFSTLFTYLSPLDFSAPFTFLLLSTAHDDAEDSDDHDDDDDDDDDDYYYYYYYYYYY